MTQKSFFAAAQRRRFVLFALLQAAVTFVAVGIWWFFGRGVVPAANYFSLHFPFSVLVFTSMAAVYVGFWPLVWVIYPLLGRFPKSLRLGALLMQPFVHLLGLIMLAEGDTVPAYSMNYPGWTFAICGAIGSLIAATVVEWRPIRPAPSAPYR